MPGRVKPCCHAEFVVVERSPEKSGFNSGLPELNICGGDKLRFNTLPQILQSPIVASE